MRYSSLEVISGQRSFTHYRATPSMHYLIGTDEAGFGPNLGPLVISGTLWRIGHQQQPFGGDREDLYARLGDWVTKRPSRTRKGPPSELAFADSKALYKSGGGLQHLERGLWAVLATLGPLPDGWDSLWNTLDPGATKEFTAIPWYAGYDRSVPADIERDEAQRWGRRLAERFAECDVRFEAVRSRVLFPRRYNEMVDRHDSKGAALSHATLALVAELMDLVEDASSMTVICDKHGGRNRYGHLLSEHFPEHVVNIYEEGPQRSVYRFGPPGRQIEFRFQMKAESHLPVALASMASKYLRELAMGAFNDYWCRHVSGLRPTAGYPQDAKRFREEIEPTRAKLEIEDEDLWRNK